MGALETSERYARQLTLPRFGAPGQQRLASARVLVVGAGGLGSPCLLYLAAAGVGCIGVVDDDVVEESNLQRQVIHTEADVGASKVASAVRTLGALNSRVQVRAHPQRLGRENALELISGYNLVCDGSDNFATRYLVNDACAVLGKPYVFGSVYQFEGQCGVFWAGRGPQYRDLYPAPPPPELAPDCGQGGVLGALCGLVGSVMALESLKVLAGVGEPLLGRILAIDAWSMSITELPVEVRSRPASSLGHDPDATATSGGTPRDAATLSAEELWRLIDGPVTGPRPVLIDVREPVEWRAGSLPGARLIPLGDVLRGGWPADLDQAATVIFFCQAGPRSVRAATFAHGRGIAGVRVLAGGVASWRRAGLPVVAAAT